MKVIDNFLNIKELENLNKVILGKDFPWYFTEGKSFNDDGDFQHCHIFKELTVLIENAYLTEICLKIDRKSKRRDN